AAGSGNSPASVSDTGGAQGSASASVSYSPTHEQATFHDPAGDLLSLSAPGHRLEDVQALPAPAGNTSMAWGLVNFTVTGVAPHGQADVTLTLPTGAHPAAYYKTNPANGDLIPFAGAEIHGNIVILHLTDNGPSDGNSQLGVISDPGGPGVQQDSVVTFQDAYGQNLTLESALPLSNVQAITPPTEDQASLPWGLFTFEVDNVAVGGSATVVLTLPADAQPATYYKRDANGVHSPFT